jgi:hypothetical protein
VQSLAWPAAQQAQSARAARSYSPTADRTALATAGGKKRRRQTEGRLDQWERRDFCKLVGDWKHDIGVHQPPLRKAEANSTPAILRAPALIEGGEVSRGARLLYSTAQGLGIADAASEEVLAQLKAKHPLRRRHVRRFSTYRTGKSGPVPVKVAELGRKLRR